MTVTDETLLFRYLDEGDRDSVGELLLRYRPCLLNYLRRYCRNHADREDVVQTTFLQVLCKGHTFRRRKRFRGWIYSIASHVAIDRLRRQSRFVLESDCERGFEFLDHGAEPESEIELAELRQQLPRMVATLPLIYQSAVVAVYFDGLSRPEAAKLLGVCEPTLRTRLHVAIKRLRGLFYGISDDRNQPASDRDCPARSRAGRPIPRDAGA